MSLCNYREFTCATKGCGAIIVMRSDQESRLRQTHGTFYCPNGHSQWFPGKTEEEKRIAELEQQLERQRERTREAWEYASDVRREGLVCQWPGCRQHSYSDTHALRRHMRKAHGMPKDKEFEEYNTLTQHVGTEAI
jgi:hypothetical protein